MPDPVRVNLTHAVIGSCQVWFVPDPVYVKNNSCRNWSTSNLVHAETDKCHIWFVPELVHVKSGSYRNWFMSNLVYAGTGSCQIRRRAGALLFRVSACAGKKPRVSAGAGKNPVSPKEKLIWDSHAFRGGGAPKIPYMRPQARRQDHSTWCCAWIFRRV